MKAYILVDLALADFIASKPFGFLNRQESEWLAHHGPRVPCLIRSGCGRVVVPAEEIAERVKSIEASGDYVRDVCVTSEWYNAAVERSSDRRD